jgi:ubiquinone/menaquinone biosynthesis C-methylase UbiE
MLHKRRLPAVEDEGTKHTRIPQSKIVYIGLALAVGTPLRRLTMNANRVLTKTGVQERLTILEVGCGPGFFTIPAAKMARNGTVYALDIYPMMTEMVAKKANRSGLGNVRTITAPASKTGLADASVDLILCIDVLPDISDMDATMREMHRVLKPDGTLSVYEPHAGWEPGARKPEKTIEELTATGLFFLRSRDGRIVRFGKAPG